jgi:uncharacterized membrane protein HdeD (DUF308 family)
MTTVNSLLRTITDQWWVPLVRGIAAVIFGILTFIVPEVSMMALVILWGAYALTDGVFSIAHLLVEGRKAPGWGWVLFEGITGIAAGLVTFFWPGITGVALLYVIATWAIVVGGAKIGAAILWRREIKGEWKLALSGMLSVLFGALVIAFPGAGALSVVWMIGAYAVALGVVLIVLAVHLYRIGHPPEARATTAAASAA